MLGSGLDGNGSVLYWLHRQWRQRITPCRAAFPTPSPPAGWVGGGVFLSWSLCLCSVSGRQAAAQRSATVFILLMVPLAPINPYYSLPIPRNRLTVSQKGLMCSMCCMWCEHLKWNAAFYLNSEHLKWNASFLFKLSTPSGLLTAGVSF